MEFGLSISPLSLGGGMGRLKHIGGDILTQSVSQLPVSWDVGKRRCS